MDWFRFYHAALDDPKVQMLEPVLFKAWVNLLCLASQSDPRGVLPDIKAIAFRLRTDTKTAADLCMELENHGLLDNEYGHVGPHNWYGRQRPSDDVNARVTKHRESKKQDVTLHETDTKRYGNALDKSREDKREIREEESRDSAGANAPKPKRATTVSDDFSVSDEMTNWAFAEHFTYQEIDEQTALFLDHFKANGKPMKDWPATWRNWMRRSRTWARPPNGVARPHNKAQEQEDMLIRIAKEGYR